MKGRVLRWALLALAVAGFVALVANFDAAHWWLARKIDTPPLYAWHADHECVHQPEARQRHHDGVWALVLEDKQQHWLFEYTSRYAEGPHAEEAREIADDRYWRQALADDRPGSYVSFYPSGRHIEEAKVAAFESAWRKAEANPTIQGYADYLAVAPGAPRAAEAQARIAELEWREIQTTRLEHAVVAFIEAKPDGPHAVEARARLDEVRYERSREPGADEVAALLAYLRKEPQGRHVVEARERLEAPLFQRAREFVDTDGIAQWELVSELEAAGGPTIDMGSRCLLAYLRWFPDGAHATEVRARLEPRLWSSAILYEAPNLYAIYRDALPNGVHADEARKAAEGEDLSDLVARGVVTVDALGSSITNVGARLTWVAPDAAPTPDDANVCDGVTIRIPAGSYFASGSGNVQNMLSYRTSRLRLHRGNRSANPTLDVVCANQHRAIPTSQNGMTFAGAAPSEDLVRVAREIEAENAPYATAQAAIWIVSDDATADGLASLVWQSNGVTHGSVIRPSDMGRAVELCSRAGIDIRARAIWKDRFALRAHVGPELRAAFGATETLEQAARFGSAEELEAKLQNQRPDWSVTYDVLNRDDEALVRVLARASPDVSQMLRVALINGRAKWMPLLIELGADPLAPEPGTGLTPLGLAASRGDLESMAFCVARGADLEGVGTGNTPLWQAASAGQIEAVRDLLARGAKVDGGDETALMGAVFHPEVARLLLEHGADVQRVSRGEDPRTVLAYALEIQFGTDAVVDLLLEHGANPNLGSQTRSPLQLAAERGRFEAARALLAAGAKPEQRPEGTPTPLELARAYVAELEADPYPRDWEIERVREVIDLLDD